LREEGFSYTFPQDTSGGSNHEDVQSKPVLSIVKGGKWSVFQQSVRAEVCQDAEKIFSSHFDVRHSVGCAGAGPRVS
jgi:hypothetical protein